MKTFRTITTLVVFLIASTSAAGPTGPKLTTKSPKVKTEAPKTKVSAQAPKSKVTTESAKAKVSTQSAKKTETGKSAKAETDKSAKSSKKTTTTTTEPTTTPAATAETPEVAEPNAISTKISGKPDQLAKITAMLPEGMTLEQATAGFKNQGQFMATLNASKNQTLSFVELQKAVTVDGLSVGQAVKKVKATPPPAPTTTTPPGGGTL